MSFKSIKSRAAALIVAVTLVGLYPVALAPMNASAKSLEQLQADSERLQKEASALNRTISEQERSLTNQQAYVNALDKKIDNTIAQINTYDARIDKLEAEISALNGEIKQKQTEISEKETSIADRFEALRARLRAISKTGNFSTLQMIMNTDSYTDYLIKSEMMKRVAKRDKKLMDDLESEIEAINTQKDKLEINKSGVSKKLSEAATLKKQANAKKSELEVDYSKRNVQLNNTKNSLNTNKQRRRATQKEIDELEAQIRQIINQNVSVGKYGGGTMYWPVPAVRNISSFYGKRWGRLHKGIDIANGSVPVYGQNIVAAHSGTVIYSNYTSVWGGGYGYHIIIDHGVDGKGRKISTLYAHCSKVFVRVGDKVVGGKTVIAKAGSTGDVTGPHLHFEVRENGVAVDPLAKGYLKVN